MDLSSATVLAMRNASMAALAAKIDAAGAGAQMLVYSTARPSPGGAAGGAAMVAVAFKLPCGSASAGVLNITDTDYAQINNSGSAVWARVVDGAGAWVGDFSVGTQAMHTADPLSAEVIVGTITMYSGAFLALIGAKIVSS